MYFFHSTNQNPPEMSDLIIALHIAKHDYHGYFISVKHQPGNGNIPWMTSAERLYSI